MIGIDLTGTAMGQHTNVVRQNSCKCSALKTKRNHSKFVDLEPIPKSMAELGARQLNRHKLVMSDGRSLEAEMKHQVKAIFTLQAYNISEINGPFRNFFWRQVFAAG